MIYLNNYKEWKKIENQESFEKVKIDLEKFKVVWDPFKTNIWIKLDKPITKEEIKEYLDKNILIPPDSPKKMLFNFWDESSREEHLARIAWFVKNYDEKYPILIDFGVIGYNDITVEDGNHRLAAAIYLNKPYVIAYVSGSIDRIKEFLY